ncbi:hypothetical protein RhiirA1_465870, partial [Rhizophagus irregularis]
NTSLSDDLPDYTSLGCLPIDLSNDTFISNLQIDLLNDLNHPQTNYSTSNNSSVDLSSDTSLNSPIDLPDNTSLSHPSTDTSNNTSYPLINQTKELTSLTSLNYPTQNTLKPEIKTCLEYNKEEKFANEMHVVRHPYHKEATVTLSGNKVIDDFIISMLSNRANYENKRIVNLEFVPYERFENIKFIAEGGFSKIYKATWID